MKCARSQAIFHLARSISFLVGSWSMISLALTCTLASVLFVPVVNSYINVSAAPCPPPAGFALHVEEIDIRVFQDAPHHCRGAAVGAWFDFAHASFRKFMLFTTQSLLQTGTLFRLIPMLQCGAMPFFSCISGLPCPLSHTTGTLTPHHPSAMPAHLL